MRVFLRYITKNMLEKKGRFFLLIFSIMVSTALLVFSLGTVNVILDGYTDTLKSVADGKDIALFSNGDNVFFDENDFDPAGLKNFEGRLDSTGIINEDDEITYVGINGLKDCNKYLTDGNIPEGSSEAICAISDRIAKDKDWKIGSVIDLKINGESHPFTIKAISAPKGMYYGDSKQSFDIAVPYEYMNQLMEAGGKYTSMRAECSGDSVKAADKFNEKNDDIAASSLTDLSAYKSMLSSTEMTVYLMFAIVCIVCCIIIHGAFKLIITERMTVIGTFMSQGATRKKISHILLMESFLYGLVGSIFGVALGEVILYFITRATSPMAEYDIYMPFHIRPSLIITGIIFAIAMCVISAWMPINGVKKLPVKDVILNRLELKHKKGQIRFIIGCILLGIAVIGAYVKGLEQVSIILLFAAFIGIGMLLRKLLKVVAGALSKVFRKNTSVFLALNNIKSSKLLRSNITLMVISFSAVLAIASAGTSLVKVVSGAYDDLSFDYEISNIIGNNAETPTTDYIVEKLDSLETVNSDTVTPIYSAMGMYDKEMVFFEAADPDKYAEYNQYLKLTSADNKEGFERYKSADSDSILISDKIARLSDKDVGDNITFEVDEKDYTFKIAGTFDAKLYNNGSVILCKPEVVKEQFHFKEASCIAFKVNGDKETAEKEFKSYISDFGSTYISWDDMREKNIQSNKQIVMLLSIFAYLAMIVAAIGIFNNIAISFQQRRKEFAVMSSVGLNAKKRKGLVFTENMFCVIMSIIISVPFTIVLCRIFTKILTFLDMPFDMTFDWSSLPQYSIVLFVVIFIASLSTMKKSKKINVVQELKYE
ncbi:MAG: ABC transporter permease [Ruminococcus sp.]|nr:ABC transporter permease [Ruminococcus sp.]